MTIVDDFYNLEKFYELSFTDTKKAVEFLNKVPKDLVSHELYMSLGQKETAKMYFRHYIFFRAFSREPNKKEKILLSCVLQNESAEYCSTAWRCYFTWRGEYDSLPLAKPALDIAGFMAYNSCSQRLHVKLQHCVVAVAILCIFSLQNTSAFFIIKD